MNESDVLVVGGAEVEGLLVGQEHEVMASVRHAYLARISLVDSTAFRYLGDTVTGDRATVMTQVVTKRGSVIGVNYAVSRERGDNWRVQDVLVEGISLLDNYRTQFASIIARSSYEALVERLRSRVREHG